MAEKIRLSSNNTLDNTTFTHYKKVFWGWAIKNWSSAGDDTIEEVFFDALAVFVEYQQKGKIVEHVKPTTFIISVAHRMFQKKHQSVSLELKVDLPVHPHTTNDDHERKAVIRKALQQLSEKCREILIAKYYHNYSMEEIMLETGAASRATVRTQKKRCMQQLKGIVVKMM